MKKIVKIVLLFTATMLGIFGLIVAIAQTSWFKSKVEHLLFDVASRSGWSLSIKNIHGSIPLKWEVEELCLTSKEGLSIKADLLKIRVALLPLLRGNLKTASLKIFVEGSACWDQLATKGSAQLEVKGPWKTWKSLATTGHPLSLSSPLSCKLLLNLDRIAFSKTQVLDMPWTLQSTFSLHPNRTIDVEKITLTSQIASLIASGRMLKDFSIEQLHYQLDIPSLIPFSHLFSHPFAGHLQANGTLQEDLFKGFLEIDEGRIGMCKFQQSTSWMSLRRLKDLWQGTTHFLAKEKTLHLEGDASLTVSHGQFLLNDIVLEAPGLRFGGSILFDYKRQNLQSAICLHTSDLGLLDPIFPNLGLGGQMGIEFANDGFSMKAFGSFSSFEMRHLKIEEGTISLNTSPNASENDNNSLEIHAERVYLPEVYIGNINLQLSSSHEKNTWQFNLSSQGTWKEPFSMITDGTFHLTQEESQVIFNHLEGSCLSHPIKIQEPCSFTLKTNDIIFDIPSLELGEGQISLHYGKTISSWNLHLKGEKIPLGWLALFTPWVSLEAEASILSDLEGSWENVSGMCRMNIMHLNAKRFGNEPSFQASGSLLANFEDKRVQIHSELYAPQAQLLLFNASLPLTFLPYHLFPLRIDDQNICSGSLLLEGKVEEFSEFFDMGFHRWQGWVSSKMLFSGTLASPLVHGDCSIHGGTYENDLVGLKLENIYASIEASRNQVRLISFSAKGAEGKGSLAATGALDLLRSDEFPYHFSLQINELPTVSLDLVEATLSGPIEIKGTKKEASLRGTLQINDASFSPPRSLPEAIPDLPIIFINQPDIIDGNLVTPSHHFPFHLDLGFHSSRSIHFNNGGLTSTWSGDFHLHGVNLNLLASGTLRLDKGQFSLLGKTFQLGQGEISFTDRPGQEGLLNVAGTLVLNDATITAKLFGALSSPQMTLESVPSMTTSDIFSLILFNKKAAEIKPIQAMQLARTIISLSGHGAWNFVDQIGNGLNVLGIDTFDIIPSEEGLNQTSITIGKHFYLVRSVLVSLTQSLSSSHFVVEVDLGKGLIFQAENESDENQAGQIGKFSLKWNKNY